MFLSRNKKNNVYPCKPLFYYIKVGFKGVKIIRVCFRDVTIVWLFEKNKTKQKKNKKKKKKKNKKTSKQNNNNNNET